ncbi:Glycosyltransferases involved in cell wall biogenesis [Acidisarcina polymorpha]|uniref:Glycosyltransferases involved in cell wall biogenesis n=1 Tax=Acidisarcina polymorpha TaxID=2211140 RepID=A0A2Z5G2Q1_9BACT|nr:glycosyltransferase family 2 protein [Acidisarcina polymorpha]AXC12957.1 Glycosyltransferases involved in cell wall biogenesis [Acidisarcina polymorpha]
MILIRLIELVLFCSVVPAALFLWNVALYHEPRKSGIAELKPLSVLIPARNEERSICASVESVLLSRDIEFEIIVLDDSSTDRTEEMVAQIAASDPRVRVEPAPPLPAGWNGKQHACYVLASLARYDTFCFLDADVRLQPGALSRMSAFLETSGSDLVSGFPFQETKTFLEWLLLPLIHFVLLAYLPIAGMRKFRAPGFAAGCGQFLMVRRAPYFQSGGHAAIRTTMHDGLLLPQLLRKHGFRTDIADLTNLATCRMYQCSSEVWSGLAKNATEGLAAPSRILFFSGLLFFGQIAPLLLAVAILITPLSVIGVIRPWIFAAVLASLLPRLVAVMRFRQRLMSAVLHPIGIAVLLALQWYAFFRKLAGQQATWKDRVYNAG